MVPSIKIDKKEGEEADAVVPEDATDEENTDDTDPDAKLLRLLASEIEHSIEEVLDVRVGDDDPDDNLDKGIEKLELIELDDREMEVKITFNDHEAISSDVTELDYLAVKFLLPRLFIDAETGEPLDKSSHNSEVDLKP